MKLLRYDHKGKTHLGAAVGVDYEVELGAVIGRSAKVVSEADASACVFEYFVANDVSARDWQFHSPAGCNGPLVTMSAPRQSEYFD